ncbi:MAG: TonB-dependent receptor plug domain-containing protein, partial [Bacteroidetes bacterium]|nr:TonB-dependent receptor plug domain-containing protein [Bacteroidota bacterium]
MKRLVFPLLLLSFFASMQAQNFTISGYVEDQSSGERLLNANVYNPQTLQGVITNNYGFYSLTISSDSLQLTYSYIGYQSQIIQIDLKKDTLINVLLVPVINIDEVVISAEKAKSTVRSTQISMTELSAKEIKSIPVLFGEVDVLKALQLLPGVQSGNEGTSGIYVRGGGPDQNLILLDGVPVYNANHLFGFFSVFNP